MTGPFIYNAVKSWKIHCWSPTWTCAQLYLTPCTSCVHPALPNHSLNPHPLTEDPIITLSTFIWYGALIKCLDRRPFPCYIELDVNPGIKWCHSNFYSDKVLWSNLLIGDIFDAISQLLHTIIRISLCLLSSDIVRWSSVWIGDLLHATLNLMLILEDKGVTPTFSLIKCSNQIFWLATFLMLLQ